MPGRDSNRFQAVLQMNEETPVVEGTITNVDASNRAKIELTIETEDHNTFTESYDCTFNQARAIDFSHRYGSQVADSEGMNVNVYTGDNYNHIHILRSYPLKTIGGKTLVGEQHDLPVEMQ